jgi:hypothetical protein
LIDPTIAAYRGRIVKTTGGAVASKNDYPAAAGNIRRR